jgi:hypothetical protein
MFAVAAAAAAGDLNPPPTPGRPCRETAGAEKAKTLAKQCREVSPATHPPCNAANECSLIVDEITRGCAMIEKDAPAFCAEYARKP